MPAMFHWREPRLARIPENEFCFVISTAWERSRPPPESTGLLLAALRRNDGTGKALPTVAQSLSLTPENDFYFVILRIPDENGQCSGRKTATIPQAASV